MRKLRKDIGSFVGVGASLGIGTTIVATAGGTSVLPAFSTFGGMMGPVATGMMAGHVLKPLRKIRRSLR